MGLRYKIPAPPIYWWSEGDYGFTSDELLMIRTFVNLKTFEGIAIRQWCSLSTVRRKMAPILTKIRAENRQDALNIFQMTDAPSHLCFKGGD